MKRPSNALSSRRIRAGFLYLRSDVRTSEGGFTLLELIIYAAISAIVLIGVLSLLSLLLTTWGKGRGRAVVEEQMRGAVDRMRYDVENAQGIISPQYAEAVMADAPEGYWHLGEISGTAAADDSGNNLTGSGYTGGYTLGVSSALATADAAVTLNGSTGLVSVNDNALLDITSAISIEAWVKRSVTGTLQDIVDKGANAYELYISAGNAITLAKTGVGTIVASTATLTDTTSFHHIIATYNGTTGKIYLDGVDVSGATTVQVLAANAVALGIGARIDVPGQYFNGTIDEVAIYNTILTPDRVSTHYNEGAGKSLVIDGGATTRAYSGFAYSTVEDPDGSANRSGIGWISFNCSGLADPWDCVQTDATYNNYAVQGTLGSLSGFAMMNPDPETGASATKYSDFISFNCNTSPNSDPCSSSAYRVTIDANGKYHGWAWGEAVGWISFNCADQGVCGTSNYKVYEIATGGGWELHGWAWSEDYGWISFNCADRGSTVCTNSPYKVTASLAGNNVAYNVNSSGVLTGSIAGGAQSNLTDSNVSLSPCTDHLGYFVTVANPAPSRPTVLVCFKATYTGKNSSVVKYSTEYKTTFQLQ